MTYDPRRTRHRCNANPDIESSTDANIVSCVSQITVGTSVATLQELPCRTALNARTGRPADCINDSDAHPKLAKCAAPEAQLFPSCCGYMFMRGRTVTVPRPLPAHFPAFTDFEILHILITPALNLAARRFLILEEISSQHHQIRIKRRVLV